MIPSLMDFVGPEMPEDKSLCPVRAVRHYLARTHSRREGKSLFFVSIKEGFKGGIHPPTLSGWVKGAVTLAYETLQPEDCVRGGDSSARGPGVLLFLGFLPAGFVISSVTIWVLEDP